MLRSSLSTLCCVFAAFTCCSCGPLYVRYAIRRPQAPASSTTDSFSDNSGQIVVRLHARHGHYPKSNQLQLTLELSNPTGDTLFVRPDCIQVIGGPLPFDENSRPGAPRTTSTGFVLPPGDRFRLLKVYNNGQKCSFRRFSRLLTTQLTVLTLDGLRLGEKPLSFDTLQLSPAS